MVTIHLTDTETQFLLTSRSLFKQDIVWNDLFMSEALCRYGLQHKPACHIDLLLAIAKTASYNTFILPDITALFRYHTNFFNVILGCMIKIHRPLPMLIYMFQLYGLSCHDSFAGNYCDYAAAANNTEALEWLRDSTTGDGVYPWSEWTCATAAKHGHFAMLERLRDPKFDNGVCPWDSHACWCAARTGQLEVLIWLRNPKTGGGVCPWYKLGCLCVADTHDYSAIAAWIMAQPDEDWN